MAKIYKMEMYITDTYKYSDFENLLIDIENSTDCIIACFDKQEVEVEWHDDIDINFSDCPVETYRKYFK